MFDPVDLKMDFIKQEHQVLEFWEREKIFQQLVDRNTGKKHWSFIDGPMTANNPMGVHHAWGRTYKDVFQRFKAMQGFDQRYQNGFDCQGLWLEVETERALGFKTKQDIEAYGLDNFSRACRARVEKYSKVQTEQSIRLGQWMHWDDSYYTMTDTNIEYIWHFLKVCSERGWLEMGHHVMPWCTRCGTSLSQHELADSYQDIDDTSVFLGFKLKPGRRREGPWLGGASPSRLPADGEMLLIWTTTPWTLTSNVGAAVNRDLTYARVKYKETVLYMSADVVETIFKDDAEVLETFPGSEMLGWEYEGPFDDLPVQEGTLHVVIPWNEVGETEGSGIVHIAPGCGAEDFELGKKYGLRAIAPLDDKGIYHENFDWLSGQNVHAVEKSIFEDLKKKGIFVKSETYNHRYPFCWRCKEKLVFRLEDEWFIKCDEIRPLMKEAARNVRWIPESVGKRTQDWYDNMGDWCISRKRYWGLPLPFYFCEEGHLTQIGSKAELRERAVEPEKVDELPELHRPWIDEIKVTCGHEGCGKPATRIPDVGDCWLDAGIVAFSTLKYHEDKAYWDKWFPSEMICEMREQVRLWFYAMMFAAVTLEGTSPYKCVFSYEKVFDEHGKAMHKSTGNAIWFDEAAEKMGADVMRWLYCAFNPNSNLRFGFGVANDLRRRLITYWNVYSFFVTYAELDGFDPSVDADEALIGKSGNALDRWIISSLYQLVKDVNYGLENYDTMFALREADKFLEQLSTWYVRRSRRRFWKAEGDEDKTHAYRTLYHVLVTFTRLLAPITPFLSEAVYRNLTGPARAAGQNSVLKLGIDGAVTPESVHLTPYPTERPELVDSALNDGMDFVLRAVSLGRAAREKCRIKIRQPLGKVYLMPLDCQLPLDQLDDDLKEEFLREIREELNVKEVDCSVGDSTQFGQQSIKLNFPVLGKKYGKEMKALAAKVKAGEGTVNDDGQLIVGEVTIESDEFESLYQGRDGIALAHDRYTLVAMETEISEPLRLEGWAREVVRAVQDLRKQADYQVEDRITLHLDVLAAEKSDGLPKPENVVAEYGEYIKTETLSETMISGRSENIDQSAEVKLDGGHKIWVGVKLGGI